MRLAKLTRLKARILPRGRHIGDDGAQINIKALVERLFSRPPIEAREDDPGHQQERHAPDDGGEKEPLGDGARLATPRRPNHQRASPDAGGSSR